MTEIRPNTPILDRINSPEDMKNLSDPQLYQLAKELRSETISIVSETGGHLGAGLGVVELTTAIHAVFDTPKDRLIWDVSHQCYPHKILTGRRNQMHQLLLQLTLLLLTLHFQCPKEIQMLPFQH